MRVRAGAVARRAVQRYLLKAPRIFTSSKLLRRGVEATGSGATLGKSGLGIVPLSSAQIAARTCPAFAAAQIDRLRSGFNESDSGSEPL